MKAAAGILFIFLSLQSQAQVRFVDIHIEGYRSQTVGKNEKVDIKAKEANSISEFSLEKLTSADVTMTINQIKLHLSSEQMYFKAGDILTCQCPCSLEVSPNPSFHVDCTGPQPASVDFERELLQVPEAQFNGRCDGKAFRQKIENLAFDLHSKGLKMHLLSGKNRNFVCK